MLQSRQILLNVLETVRRLIRLVYHSFITPPAEVSTVKQRYAKALSTSRGPLLDLLKHICGRLPPGIVQIPAPCKTRTERVNMHYEELSVVLAFLRCSIGCCVCVCN